MLSRQLLSSTRVVSRQLHRLPPHQHISSLTPCVASSLVRSSYLPSHHLSRRWQSTEASKVESMSTQSDGRTTDASTQTSEDALKQEIEKHKREVMDLKDKYLRSVADYRNLQDRTARDNASARQFAIQKFATDLLDSIDNLDRALTSVPEAALGKTSSATTTSNTSSADSNTAASSESTTPSSQPNNDLLNLHNGLRMTEQIMMQVLKKHGLEKFDPLESGGRKFDPNLDEATFFTKVEGKQDGDVFYTQSKGYTLNGRVIRASKVGVVKNS